MPKVTITQSVTFTVEVDGKPVRGDWKMESEWNGFVELKCDAPMMKLIIRKPHIPHINSYDVLHPLFGGNVSAWKEGTPKVEIEVVKNNGVNELNPKK